MITDKIFIGALTIVSNIKYGCDQYMDTITRRSFKHIKTGFFYNYNDDKFVDLSNNAKYDSDLDSKEAGEMVIDPRTLISLSTFMKEHGVEMPNNISKRKVKKIFGIKNSAK